MHWRKFGEFGVIARLDRRDPAVRLGDESVQLTHQPVENSLRLRVTEGAAQVGDDEFVLLPDRPSDAE